MKKIVMCCRVQASCYYDARHVFSKSRAGSGSDSFRDPVFERVQSKEKYEKKKKKKKRTLYLWFVSFGELTCKAWLSRRQPGINRTATMVCYDVGKDYSMVRETTSFYC